MDKNDKIKYWQELAQYDLDTAKAMLDTGRYLYVGFMCHQVIEKIFKGYYIYKKDDNPSYTHNLLKIAQDGDFYSELDETHKDLIDYLQPLNIEARYPTYKEELMKSLTKEKCVTIMFKTEELLKWIKIKL